MRIGVVSDTHIPNAMKKPPKELLRAFENADLIIHAGDIAEMSVIKTLRSLADVCAVHGNADPAEVRAELPESRVLTVQGKRIGIYHGRDGHAGLADRAQRLLEAEHGGTFDVVVFGHTHQATEDWTGPTLRFNPGSPAGRRFTEPRTFGILTLGDTVESEIVHIS